MNYNILINGVYLGYNPLILAIDPNFQRAVVLFQRRTLKVEAWRKNNSERKRQLHDLFFFSVSGYVHSSSSTARPWNMVGKEGPIRSYWVFGNDIQFRTRVFFQFRSFLEAQNGAHHGILEPYGPMDLCVSVIVAPPCHLLILWRTVISGMVHLKNEGETPKLGILLRFWWFF